MQTFKKFLLEGIDTDRFNPQTAQKWFLNAQTILGDKIFLNEDNTISTHRKCPNLGKLYSTLFHKYKGQKCLKIKFKTVGDWLDLNDKKLDTLIGCPDVILGTLDIRNNKITNLEGLPWSIGRSLNLTNNPGITSLTGIHTRLRECETIELCGTIQDSMLGLLRIDKLLFVSLEHTDKNFLHAVQLKRAINIINEHMASKDILECQEELISAGLKEYAKF